MDTELRTLTVERSDTTVTITLNRPAQRNALTAEMIGELHRTLDEVGESDALAVVLAANGPVYCAGHDFAEMYHQDLMSVRRLFASCAAMMETMQQIPQPVIARVHALATGAGCQLVATADLAVASHGASFATPGGKGGLFCTTPLVAVGRNIARKRALEMGLSGDAIDARTAYEWGLINDVVDENELVAATDALVSRVTRGSVASRAIGKRAFYAQIGLDQHAAYDLANEVMAAASLIDDAQEGIAAFLEKRPAVWTRGA